MQDKEINLPFGEAISRSFRFVFDKLDVLLKLSVVWGIIIFVADILSGFPSLCQLNAENCNKGQSVFYYVALYLSSVSIIIAYIRYVINREDKTILGFFHFGKRELLYIWTSIKLGGAVIFFAFIFSLLYRFAGFPRTTSILLLLVTLFVICVVFSRYILIFPAVAMDDKEIGFETSFIITKGNCNKIFWGIFLIALPVFFANFFIAHIYISMASSDFGINILFSLLVLVQNILDIALKGSFLAHIYQYFAYFYHKQARKD